MFNKLINYKTLLAFGIITLLLASIAIFYKPKLKLPTVITSIPTTNSTKVNYFDSIGLQFDQAIDSNLVTAQSTPEEIWSIQNVDKDKISLSSKQYLRVDTQYKLEIFYNKKLVYILNFKTIPQQSDPRYAQEVMNTISRDYPLSTKTPFENSNFKAVYSEPLTLEITIKNKDFLPSDAILETKEWVTQNGGDVSSHKFTIATP